MRSQNQFFFVVKSWFLVVSMKISTMLYAVSRTTSKMWRSSKIQRYRYWVIYIRVDWIKFLFFFCLRFHNKNRMQDRMHSAKKELCILKSNTNRNRNTIGNPYCNSSGKSSNPSDKKEKGLISKSKKKYYIFALWKTNLKCPYTLPNYKFSSPSSSALIHSDSFRRISSKTYS